MKRVSDRTRVVVCASSVSIACLVACSYDWGGNLPPATDSGNVADVSTTDATTVDECRAPSDCPKTDEPVCCYAVAQGKSGTKCRAETQCLNQGGKLVCKTNADCPASKPTCDLSAQPVGACQ